MLNCRGYKIYVNLSIEKLIGQGALIEEEMLSGHLQIVYAR